MPPTEIRSNSSLNSQNPPDSPDQIQRKTLKNRLLQDNEQMRSDLSALKKTAKDEERKLLADRYESKKAISSQTYEDIQKIKSQAKQQMEATHQYYKDLTDKTKNHYIQEQLSHEQKIQRDLDASRSAQLSALKRYQEAQEDPFYRIQSTKPNIAFEDDGAWIRIHAPPHEISHIQILPSENKVSIQGTRQFSDQLKNPDGTAQKTASFQTYREEIPLPFLASPKDLVLRRYADRIEAFIPRRQTSGLEADSEPKTQIEAKLERPDFPAFLGQPVLMPNQTSKT